LGDGEKEWSERKQDWCWPTLILLESLYCQDVRRVVCVFVFSGEYVVGQRELEK